MRGPMKIHVSQIPGRGLVIEEELPLEWVIDGSSARESDAFYPADSVQVSAEIHKTGRRLQVKGKSSTFWRGVCSRCLSDVRRETTVVFDDIVLPADEYQAPTSRVVDLKEEDFLNYYYEGDIFDFGRHLIEKHLLELPMAPRCEAECPLSGPLDSEAVIEAESEGLSGSSPVSASSENRSGGEEVEKAEKPASNRKWLDGLSKIKASALKDVDGRD